MILMIFKVISIMVIVVRLRVPQDHTLVFRLGHHICKGLAGLFTTVTRSHVAILLVSKILLGSKYCYNQLVQYDFDDI